MNLEEHQHQYGNTTTMIRHRHKLVTMKIISTTKVAPPMPLTTKYLRSAMVFNLGGRRGRSSFGRRRRLSFAPPVDHPPGPERVWTKKDSHRIERYQPWYRLKAQTRNPENMASADNAVGKTNRSPRLAAGGAAKAISRQQ
jgi:hypothetical protein